MAFLTYFFQIGITIRRLPFLSRVLVINFRFDELKNTKMIDKLVVIAAALLLYSCADDEMNFSYELDPV